MEESQTRIAIHWNEQAWDPTCFKNAIAEVFKKRGYQVSDRHGNLEQGSDLIATKFDPTGRRIIERLGIQVTRDKADKNRVKDAATAFMTEDSTAEIDSYLIYTLKGKGSNFDSHLARLETTVRENTVVYGREEIEEQILRAGVTPDEEFGYHWKDFSHSSVYDMIMEIGDILAQGENERDRGRRRRNKAFSRRVIEPAVKSLKTINNDLRFLIRKLESVQTICIRATNEMIKSKQDDLVYLGSFWNAVKSLYRPIDHALRVFRRLAEFPPVLRLFWISLASSSRACLTKAHPSRKSYPTLGRQEYFFFFYYDGEEAFKRGEYDQTLLLAAISGLGTAARDLKGITERILSFGISDKESLLSALSKDIRSHAF